MLKITYSDRFQKHYKKLSSEEKSQFKRKLSIFVENTITEKTVINPKINPIKGNVNPPINGIDNPVTITSPAPKDAPEDTPKVYGDANSFFSID